MCVSLSLNLPAASSTTHYSTSCASCNEILIIILTNPRYPLYHLMPDMFMANHLLSPFRSFTPSHIIAPLTDYTNSDGAGRTGTYCLIDMVLNRMSKGKHWYKFPRISLHDYIRSLLTPLFFSLPITLSLMLDTEHENTSSTLTGAKEIDIAATLEHLRDQRMHMVRTKNQFEFVLKAVADEVHAVLRSLHGSTSWAGHFDIKKPAAYVCSLCFRLCDRLHNVVTTHTLPNFDTFFPNLCILGFISFHPFTSRGKVLVKGWAGNRIPLPSHFSLPPLLLLILSWPSNCSSIYLLFFLFKWCTHLHWFSLFPCLFPVSALRNRKIFPLLFHIQKPERIGFCGKEIKSEKGFCFSHTETASVMSCSDQELAKKETLQWHYFCKYKYLRAQDLDTHRHTRSGLVIRAANENMSRKIRKQDEQNWTTRRDDRIFPHDCETIWGWRDERKNDTSVTNWLRISEQPTKQTHTFAAPEKLMHTTERHWHTNTQSYDRKKYPPTNSYPIGDTMNTCIQ